MRKCSGFIPSIGRLVFQACSSFHARRSMPSQSKRPPHLDGGRALCCNPWCQAGPTAWLPPRARDSREAISIVLSEPAHIICPTCAQVKPPRGRAYFNFGAKDPARCQALVSYFEARGGSDNQPLQVLSWPKCLAPGLASAFRRLTQEAGAQADGQRP